MAVLQDIFIYKSRQWARDSLTSGSTELLLEKCAQSGTNSLASLIIGRGHMTELMPVGHKWKLRGHFLGQKLKSANMLSYIFLTCINNMAI